MHVHLVELAARQLDLVAAWQLVEAGWTRAMVDHHVREHRWRPVHAGVYAVCHSPLTREQSWMAATLTAPDTVLSHASAGAYYGIWSFSARYETVTRPGNGGPRRHGDVLVSHSKTLDGDTTVHNGIPITTAARTIVDLALHGDPARMFREALRLKLTTPYLLAVGLQKHRGRRGTHGLKRLNDRYAAIPYARTRSNAEAKAL